MNAIEVQKRNLRIVSLYKNSALSIAEIAKLFDVTTVRIRAIIERESQKQREFAGGIDNRK